MRRLDFDLKVLLNCLHCTFRAAVAPPDEKMGRIFLDHIGGSRLFSCANCDTILTNRAELISTRFTGATGRAFLFNKVVNLQHSEVQDRVMLTGRHMVRDVSCKNCNSKLGWMYEFATEESQRYKEGRIILERALVRESEGFEHVVNLQHSEVQDRVMLTGRHMVRDVSCKNCNSKLGWMYEFATEESQRYKEGRIILERALVRESEGFEH
ncbi:hypothetical protein CRENBAI_009408, partial [Crenichthys baileyi]